MHDIHYETGLLSSYMLETQGSSCLDIFQRNGRLLSHFGKYTILQEKVFGSVKFLPVSEKVY